MRSNRRGFLKQLGGAAVGGGALASSAEASDRHGPCTDEAMAVMVDLTECIGCRRCEHACKKSNGVDPGPVEAYDDQSVFKAQRRPVPDQFTVINSYTPAGQDKPVYAKVNCLHCNHPACVSACIVGALQKQPDGAVTYDAWKCIGCRYCMVACPFQIPTYSYDDVLTPEVLKCEFCHSDRTSKGLTPACQEACPRNVMKFGKRKDLLEQAHAHIQKHPDRYIDHIYGEHEVGGTSWMYMSNVPFAQVGFLSLGTAAPPVLTEAIQHGVFKYWIAPVGWYGFLSAAYWWTGRKHRIEAQKARISSEMLDNEERHSSSKQLEHHAAAIGGEDDVHASTATAVLEAPDERPADDHTDEAHVPHEAHAGHDANHDHHSHAAPVDHKLMTPGVWALLIMVLTGVGFGLYRFIFGLAASTNLNQQYPWGLWIAMDVGSGIALAGGGFVSAAIIHVFHRERYHGLARSALLTALLGYTFYVPGLLADIGRWYNIWHPTLPNMWQGNSVLFEVGICVMIYLNVQYAELMPIICERLMVQKKRVWLARLAKFTHDKLNLIMPALLVLGVTLSTFHQSSLGNLMNIAPYKLHHLWWSPLSPLLFLLSAMMVGFPMVIFTILFASKCVKRKPEMEALTPLATKYVPVFIVLYLAVKIGDVIWRGMWRGLGDGSVESISWLVEVGAGVVLPLVLLMFPAIRRSPRWLALTCLIVILGVVLNRLNVFVIAYHPPYVQKSYFPSLAEFMVSMGLVAALMLVYRVAITYLPILDKRPKVA